MPDHLIRSLLAEKKVRAVAAVTTDLCRHAAEVHGLVGPAAEALARLLTAAGLLATITKDRELVSVQIQTEGPLALLVADADAQGNIRGYARFRRDVPGRRSDQVPAAADRDFGQGRSGPVRVEDLLGREGTVAVIRDLGLRELYQGVAELTNGSVDLDVETYLNQSEQLPSFLRCRALLDPEGRIQAAAGLLLQSMPGGREHLEKVTSKLADDFLEGFLVDVVARDAAAEDLLRGLGFEDLDIAEWRELRFRCRCSKQSAERALETLSIRDIEDMLTKDGKAEVTCHYCTRTWTFDAEELSRILREMRATGPESGAEVEQ